MIKIDYSKPKGGTFTMNSKLLQPNGFMPWEKNPECFRINKAKPHSDIIPFPTVEDALSWNKEARDITDLNGTWKFRFLKTRINATKLIPRAWSALWIHITGDISRCLPTGSCRGMIILST